MNAPRPDAPSPPAADHDLRQQLRDTLARTPPDGLQALQARTLAQWRTRDAAPRRTGPLAALQARWQQHRLLFTSALLALGIAGLLLARSVATPEPGIDELMQPDVLSLISLGEL